jgi:hypothetical protein
MWSTFLPTYATLKHRFDARTGRHVHQDAMAETHTELENEEYDVLFCVARVVKPKPCATHTQN